MAKKLKDKDSFKKLKDRGFVFLLVLLLAISSNVYSDPDSPGSANPSYDSEDSEQPTSPGDESRGRGHNLAGGADGATEPTGPLENINATYDANGNIQNVTADLPFKCAEVGMGEETASAGAGDDASASTACVIQNAKDCGNNLKEGAEECDDGNKQNGDGCTDRCKFEPVACLLGAGHNNLIQVAAGANFNTAVDYVLTPGQAIPDVQEPQVVNNGLVNLNGARINAQPGTVSISVSGACPLVPPPGGGAQGSVTLNPIQMKLANGAPMPVGANCLGVRIKCLAPVIQPRVRANPAVVRVGGAFNANVGASIEGGDGSVSADVTYSFGGNGGGGGSVQTGSGDTAVSVGICTQEIADGGGEFTLPFTFTGPDGSSLGSISPVWSCGACGNGEVEAEYNEQCDGGAICNDDCTFKIQGCGNGVLESGEQCDPSYTQTTDENGNISTRPSNTNATCTENCELRTCNNNGVVDAGESCDDGNMESCDDCSNSCVPVEKDNSACNLTCGQTGTEYYDTCLAYSPEGPDSCKCVVCEHRDCITGEVIENLADVSGSASEPVTS